MSRTLLSRSMTDDTMNYCSLSLASVATILVDVPTADAVTTVLEEQGLPWELRDGTVETTLVRPDGEGGTVELLVDVDTVDGVVHVHGEDHADAYALAPAASSVLDAIDGVESQSLFTYTVAFDHPLVEFGTLVEYLEGEWITFHDPDGVDPGADGGRGGEESGGPGVAAGDGRAVPDEGFDGDRPSPPSEPGAPDRPHLVATVDGDRFELYEDGYLLPVDDASGAAVGRFLATVDRRLRESSPSPPPALSAAELPDGWAGPLVDRHPEVTAIVEAWAELEANGVTPELAPGGVEGGTAAVAEAVLDVAVALVYALDQCSPSTRELYYDRYVDAEGSPFRVPITAVEDGDVDADRFANRPLWAPELERAVAETRREVRELGRIADSYEGRDLRVGQVWRHRVGDGDRVTTVAVTGRERVGDAFVSLPVWVGEVRSVEGNPAPSTGGSSEDAESGSSDETGDDADPGPTDDLEGGSDPGSSDDPGPVGERVVVDGERLLELVESPGDPE